MTRKPTSNSVTPYATRGSPGGYRRIQVCHPHQARLTDPHHHLGHVLIDQGNRQQATAEFREAIRIEPDNPEPHKDLGNVLSDEGSLEEAIAEYRKAIRSSWTTPEPTIASVTP